MEAAKGGAAVTGHVEVSTYPLELLSGAVELVSSANRAKESRIDDGRNIPTLAERAFARAAIFTAFNFLESLLIELAQLRIKEGPVLCEHCAATITADLKAARAGISTTHKQWPVLLTGRCVYSVAGNPFARFSEIRILRNELIHPKLEALGTHERTQDELLKEMTSDRASEIVREIKKMAKALYELFDKSAPPEVC